MGGYELPGSCLIVTILQHQHSAALEEVFALLSAILVTLVFRFNCPIHSHKLCNIIERFISVSYQ